ncbi:extracellular matrix protein 2 [Protopterus annectens]|uniref:extracellular matrix protein 2 n=1 Tax=Protopterus annectens TaxID=7888 RepID=UPI001CFA87C4|nr:extracellular matrix protein 2 [Protopterus annectens]
MRIQTTVLLLLLICLSISLGQHEKTQERNVRRRRTRPKGPKIPLAATRKARRQSKPERAVITQSYPEINMYDNIVTVIESYKGLQQPQSSYSVLPGKKGHCKSNGMILHDNAVWSPKPCITCLCTNGNTACDVVMCPTLTCPQTETPDGECCPICKEIVTNVLPESDKTEFSGDSSEPNDPSEPIAAPRTQAEIDELLRQEEEQQEEEEEMMHKKEAERKRKKELKKQEEEQRRKMEELKQKEEEEMFRKQEEEEIKRALLEEEELRESERLRQAEEERQKEENKKLEKERKERKEKEKQEEEEDENEEEEILRGDVFRMPPHYFPTPESLPFHPDERPPPLHVPLPSTCIVSDSTLSCTYSKITHIPSIVDTELKCLNLAGNAITSIPAEAFNGVPNIEWIDLSKNKITSVGIDLKAFSKLKKLERLYLDGNLLEQMPSELPSTLKEVKINDNNLKRIDESSFQDLSNLVTLELEGNKLDEGSTSTLAFKPLKELSYLRLGKNRFRTIPQGLPPSIQELHLEHNLIEEISETDFNNTKHLTTLVLKYNKLDEARIAPLAWINHESLESIDLSYNKFYHVPSFLPRSLVHLVLVGNQIDRIPGYVFAHMYPGIEYLYLSFNKVNDDGIDTSSFFGAYNSLIELYMDHNDLTMVPLGISDMKQLRFLRFNNNKIRSISPHAICPEDDEDEEDLSIVSLHLENNYIDTRRISPTAFSCIPSYSGVVMKPQKLK